MNEQETTHTVSKYQSTLGFTLPNEPEPIDEEIPAPARVLEDCVNLLVERGRQYNNGPIGIPDYFPRGVEDILPMLHIKLTRARSGVYNNDAASVEDSLMDLINYASMGVSFLRGDL